MIFNRRRVQGYSDTPYQQTAPMGPITPAQYIEEQSKAQGSGYSTADLMAKANEISARLASKFNIPTWAVVGAGGALALAGGYFAWKKLGRRSRRRSRR